MEVLPDDAPVVKHLMLLGTPNAGVPCVDDDASPEKKQTASALTAEKMAAFNQTVTQRKGTKFSALWLTASALLPPPMERRPRGGGLGAARHRERNGHQRPARGPFEHPKLRRLREAARGDGTTRYVSFRDGGEELAKIFHGESGPPLRHENGGEGAPARVRDFSYTREYQWDTRTHTAEP
jgi:hypothetical protein